jgi:hypothetical protein
MFQLAFVSACTAVLAVIGHGLGVTIHGQGISALFPAAAGGAGGFGIGCALIDVARRWRQQHASSTGK